MTWKGSAPRGLELEEGIYLATRSNEISKLEQWDQVSNVCYRSSSQLSDWNPYRHPRTLTLSCWRRD